jgi:hypothetical protein
MAENSVPKNKSLYINDDLHIKYIGKDPADLDILYSFSLYLDDKRYSVVEASMTDYMYGILQYALLYAINGEARTGVIVYIDQDTYNILYSLHELSLKTQTELDVLISPELPYYGPKQSRIIDSSGQYLFSRTNLLNSGIFPNITFALVHWDRYMLTPTKCDPSIMRCMRFHALTFENATIAVRDADTFFKLHMRVKNFKDALRMWESQYFEFINSKEGKHIFLQVHIDFEHPDFAMYIQPQHTNIENIVNITHVDPRIQKNIGKTMRNLLIPRHRLSNSIKKYLTNGSNTNLDRFTINNGLYSFPAPFGIYAGLTTFKKGRPSNLWHYIQDYLSSRYRLVKSDISGHYISNHNSSIIGVNEAHGSHMISQYMTRRGERKTSNNITEENIDNYFNWEDHSRRDPRDTRRQHKIQYLERLRDRYKLFYEIGKDERILSFVIIPRALDDIYLVNKGVTNYFRMPISHDIRNMATKSETRQEEDMSILRAFVKAYTHWLTHPSAKSERSRKYMRQFARQPELTNEAANEMRESIRKKPFTGYSFPETAAENNESHEGGRRKRKIKTHRRKHKDRKMTRRQ